MKITFNNHMPAWLYASKVLTPTAKLLLQRMIAISKGGAQPVCISRQEFADELGVSPRSISNAFRQLEKEELILPIKNPNPFDQTRNFQITDKTLGDEND